MPADEPVRGRSVLRASCTQDVGTPPGQVALWNRVSTSPVSYPRDPCLPSSLAIAWRARARMEASKPNCHCGRTTCLACLAQLGRALASAHAPAAARDTTTPTTRMQHTDRLGLAVENRVALLDPRLERTRRELGALVRSVAPASLGELLGVRSGDLLVAIGGTPVTTADEVRAALAAQAGTPTRVTIRRGAVRMDLALDD